MMEYEIVVDIESLPAGDMPTPDTMKPPAQMKKADTIAKWREEEAPKLVEEEFKKRALDSMAGRILCIGVAINDEEPECFYHETHEQAVLVAFEQYIRKKIDPMYTITWIGHNILGFDALWMWRRAIKYDLGWLARNFNFNKWKGNIQDTMLMWACDNYQEKRSLDDIATFLGLGGKQGINGSMVYDMFKRGEHEKIALYCKNDVSVTREVYRRIDNIMSSNMRSA